MAKASGNFSVCLVELLQELILRDLILDKSELNVKWFMFGCIYVKLDLVNKFMAKINCRSQNYKS